MIELLAPAGSLESFYAALDAGADAVYAGGSRFGARAYAQNFTQEELIQAIRHAHSRGKKLYLTVNTLMKNREMERDFFDYLSPYYEAGLDAVIVQDFGVLRFIQNYFPGLPIHISTQMTVTGPACMRFFEKLGPVDRIVPARELSLEELRAMREAGSLDIETFIHGALCYSYSGQCLFSSILGGRSGNRGRCAQPCRLPYQVSDERQKLRGSRKDLCPLSLKDICTLDILPQILEAGVTSLKIEGRMKKKEYTQGVVSIYRKYLDQYLENPSGYQVDPKDRETLLAVFNRSGSCDGYYRSHNGRHMMAFSNEKKIQDTRIQIIKNKEKVKGNLILFPGDPAILELEYQGCRIQVRHGCVQKAISQPVTRERILTQMRKSGNTPYELDPLQLAMGGEIFVPMSALNELRREGLARLEEKLADQYRRRPAVKPEFSRQGPKKREKLHGADVKSSLAFYASCETKEQFAACEKNPLIKGIYGPYREVADCLKRGNPRKKELYLMFPHVERMADREFYTRQLCESLVQEGLAGFLVRSLESFCRLEEMGFASRCVLDSSIYTWNRFSQEFWRERKILRDTVPLELNEGEIAHRSNEESELLIYGYLPLMVSAQCVRKNLDRCRKDNGRLYLKDRYGKVFPVQCYCGSCYNVIYNSLPYGLTEGAAQVEKLGVSAVRLSFTVEDGAQTEEVLRKFTGLYRDGKKMSAGKLTKGHLKRGVE